MCLDVTAGSPYTDLISDAILRLQEDQTLQTLFNRWWREKDGAGLCDDDEPARTADANALSMANVGGVFVVLAVGLLLSAVVAVIEFVCYERRQLSPVDAAKVDCVDWVTYCTLQYSSRLLKMTCFHVTVRLVT